jgi:uncharacterized membrane protein
MLSTTNAADTNSWIKFWYPCDYRPLRTLLSFHNRNYYLYTVYLQYTRRHLSCFIPEEWVAEASLMFNFLWVALIHQCYLAITADKKGGKPIKVVRQIAFIRLWTQSVSSMSAASPLVAFDDIHRRNRLFFFSDTSGLVITSGKYHNWLSDQNIYRTFIIIQNIYTYNSDVIQNRRTEEINSFA